MPSLMRFNIGSVMIIGNGNRNVDSCDGDDAVCDDDAEYVVDGDDGMVTIMTLIMITLMTVRVTMTVPYQPDFPPPP